MKEYVSTKPPIMDCLLYSLSSALLKFKRNPVHLYSSLWHLSFNFHTKNAYWFDIIEFCDDDYHLPFIKQIYDVNIVRKKLYCEELVYTVRNMNYHFESLICILDAYDCCWLPSYHKRHAYHTINILEKLEDKDVYLISDNITNSWPINISLFTDMIYSVFFLKKKMTEYIPPFKEDFSIFRIAVSDALKNYNSEIQTSWLLFIDLLNHLNQLDSADIEKYIQKFSVYINTREVYLYVLQYILFYYPHMESCCYSLIYALKKHIGDLYALKYMIIRRYYRGEQIDNSVVKKIIKEERNLLVNLKLFLSI